LKLVDPTIKLISCGKEGIDDWDLVVLKECIEVIDFHSLHLYTRGPAHEVCQTDLISRSNTLTHMHAKVNVMTPAIAEKGISITRSFIDIARIHKKVSHEVGICFDEW
jgi:alpha-N-arabinofuranosidase